MNEELKTQIPVFRAALDTEIMPNITIEDSKVLTIIDDIYYAIGLPNHKNDMEVLYKDESGRKSVFTFPFKPETLAIHHSDMIASDSNRILPNGEKDLRIFASLSEDGKGGDVCEHPYDIEEDKIYPLIYKEGGTRRYFPFGKSFVVVSKFSEYKTLGIQE